MSTPLLENILNQGRALSAVRAYQFGDGRDALEKAARLIQMKKRVVLTGMGASMFAAMPSQYAMAESGVHVAVCESAELLHFASTPIDHDTAVVLVSRSGESIEVIKLIPELEARGVVIIGVVNVPQSKLGDAADATLVLGSPADEMVAIQTYTATLVVLRLLRDFIAGVESRAFEDLEKLEAIVSEYAPECMSASEQWREFLPDNGPLYLLGRGTSLASVHEGVLLMHETAKRSAVGMSVAQFRHGPVEVVDETFRAVVFGTQPHTTELDRALVHDLNAMHGQARWIGPAPSGFGSVLIPWPASAPERFRAVLEIIPLQVLAYRWAEWRGLRPGEFRWAPLVTNAEAGFPITTAN